MTYFATLALLISLIAGTNAIELTPEEKESGKWAAGNASELMHAISLGQFLLLFPVI
jgi:hypothetical protein